MNQTIIDNQNVKPVFIFSVEQVGLTDQENKMNTNVILEQLKRLDIGFKEVIGTYTYKDGLQASERSFLIQNENNNIEDLVINICKTYNQESYLYIDEDRETFLNDIKDYSKVSKLGKFVHVSQEEALKNGNYTYCPVLDRYYIAKE